MYAGPEFDGAERRAIFLVNGGADFWVSNESTCANSVRTVPANCETSAAAHYRPPRISTLSCLPHS